MFRRLPDSLPKDPVITADLKKLGYLINKDDQIRMIGCPDEKYRYKVHRRERINDLYKEALNVCLRQEILVRLRSLGLQTLRLPLGATESSPHVPILVSPDLPNSKHVIAFFGERSQDLGIFAYRMISGDEGLDTGSAVNFVKAIQSSSSFDRNGENPAIVIANPGQLIWCRNQGLAVSRATWENLPQESSVHSGFRLDEESGRNLVEGNRDEAEHVGYVFEEVLKAAGAEQATIDVIGAEWTGAAAVKYLRGSWSTWSTRINSMCLIAPLHELQDLLPTSPAPTAQEDSTLSNLPTTRLSFAQFMSTRCRGYIVHDAPLGTLVEGRAEFGCNIYASGEHLYMECIMTRAKDHMLEWSGRLARGEADAEERMGEPGAESLKQAQDSLGTVG